MKTAFTKLAIIKAFGELAVMKTIDKITIKDIAEHCGIARNTFYYHYRDIYQVLKAFMEYKNQEMMNIIEGLGDEENPGIIYMEFACYIIDNKNLFFNMFRSGADREVKKYIEKSSTLIFNHLVERLSEGMDIPEKDKCLISSICQYAARGLIMDWFEEEERHNESGDSLPELFQQAYYLFNGEIERALKRSAAQQKL